jgi:parallel beta-helix repeat protein
MKHISLVTFVTSLALVLLVLGIPKTSQATIHNISCPGQSLQAAIDVVQTGDTINVTGTCNENLLIRNEKQRFFIIANGPATLNGPSASSPTLNIRGKGVFVQGFTITGGSRGVQINRNSNAILTNNIIQNTGGDGIVVDEAAFAVIKSNIIQNNAQNGILVSESAVARIGFEFPEDVAAQPNTIINNNGSGVMVARNSNARIVGNEISSNLGDGIFVTRNAQADIASNLINSNSGSAVNVSDNASVVMGEANPTNFFHQPNTTTSNNGAYGIRCEQGGAVRAILGSSNQVNGSVGQLNLNASCPFNLS